VTGVPVKFVGVGEKLDALEEFHPDRMAGRIWAWVTCSLSLRKRARVRPQATQAMEEKIDAGQLRSGRLPQSDAGSQKDGSLESILGMIPAATS
jgi:signal recognition particle subunit SRP54